MLHSFNWAKLVKDLKKRKRKKKCLILSLGSAYDIKMASTVYWHMKITFKACAVIYRTILTTIFIDNIQDSNISDILLGQNRMINVHLKKFINLLHYKSYF